jgi:hypothetical protein
VEERYKQLIEALYGESGILDVESDIRYRDGKGFRMQTRVRIKDVPDEQ